MIKLPSPAFNKINLGFVFWFVSGIFCTIIFYKPFEQPIFFDRAYLLYMSQVVYRGDFLYQSTTFGYTPFSTVLVGLLMKLGALFSINTIASARVVGIILYGTMCGSFFLMSKSLFNSKWATTISVLLFCGLGYIQILSGVNAEPKLWVLLFSILGIYFFSKGKWMYVGLSFSLAAMSWHVAVMSLFACAVMLPWRSKSLLLSFYKLCSGVILGVLPSVIYLAITNGWIDFWNQAILRKLVVEGAVVGEAPFMWLRNGIYPYFITEPLHFIFGALGLLLCIFSFLKKKIIAAIISQKNVLFLFFYCLFWSMFNSLDFQSCVDLFPLVPPIIIFCTYFLVELRKRLNNQLLSYVLGLTLLLYNFYDAIIYKLPFSFTDQVKVINSISEKYRKIFVLGFEEFYTIKEEPMPTKFMRYSSYEDHMIENEEKGCMGILQFIKNKKFDGIIMIDRDNKRERSEMTRKLVSILSKSAAQKQYHIHGECSNSIIENFTDTVEAESFYMGIQSILFSDAFYVKVYYSVFEVTRNQKAL